MNTPQLTSEQRIQKSLILRDLTTMVKQLRIEKSPEMKDAFSKRCPFHIPKDLVDDIYQEYIKQVSYYIGVVLKVHNMVRKDFHAFAREGFEITKLLGHTDQFTKLVLNTGEETLCFNMDEFSNISMINVDEYNLWHLALIGFLMELNLFDGDDPTRMFFTNEGLQQIRNIKGE